MFASMARSDGDAAIAAATIECGSFQSSAGALAAVRSTPAMQARSVLYMDSSQARSRGRTSSVRAKKSRACQDQMRRTERIASRPPIPRGGDGSQNARGTGAKCGSRGTAAIVADATELFATGALVAGFAAGTSEQVIVVQQSAPLSG